MHPELEDLVAAALADNKLTSKEMEVLVKKAKSLGIDPDEFLIELDAKKHNKKKHAKKESKGEIRIFLNRVIYHRDAGTKMKEVEEEMSVLKQLTGGNGGPKEFQEVPVNALTIKIGHILIPLVFVIITVFFIVGSQIIRTDYYEELDLALVDYNIERAYECLANIDYPRDNSHRKILRVAVPLYIKDGNATGALDLLNEYAFRNNITDSGNWYNNEVEFNNEMYILICNSLIQQNKKNIAEEILETKLKPYADAEGKPTFDPIADRKAFVLKNIRKK